ncbi:MAG TPA: glycosyltransferase [Sphingobacteriaceae bacterium]|nr:glycosyltransferase [Sphingobacteriaceae bacterium]
MSYSVLITTYRRDNTDHLKQALQSVLNQTAPPDEIILVKDGPLNPELEAVIADISLIAGDTMKVLALPENLGHSPALNKGLLQAKYELVARMDADDICKPDRFSKQVAFFEDNPEYAMVGGQVEEFITVPGDTGLFRYLPLTHDELVEYAKKRCPFNHPSVMYKKSVIQSVGLYEDFKSTTEDYFLWAKVIHAGYKVANLPDVLLNYRMGEGFMERRTGFAYATGEFRLLTKMKNIGFISSWRYVKSLANRMPLRLMPSFVSRFVYKYFLR